MKEKKESSFSRLMGFAKDYKSFTYISLMLSTVSSVLALLPFYYIWKIIKEVLDVMPNFQNETGIVKNGAFAVIFALLSMLIYIAALLCSHTSAFRVQANMRKQMMHKIVTLPLGEIEKIGSGKLRKTVNDCSSATETYLAHQLPDMVGSIVTPIGLLMFLLAFDWRFGLISLIPIVLSFVIMMVFMTGKTLQTKMEEYQNALDDMSNEAVEYVSGIPVVKAFGQSVFSFRKFKKSIDSYSEWAIDYTKNLRVPMAILTMLINGIFAFIIFGGLIFVRGGVTNELILNNVSFTAKQGEITALVGPSGGGKTTVSRLAARFWDATSGNITVGGMNISNVEPETLLSLYSIVFQDVTLFNTSVAENIRLGKKGATDEEVLVAAKLANCDEFVQKLANGYDTEIGENGCNLSGGERQRISIARAFLKNAPIILLDEATASLDVENETLIQTALSKLIENKTVIVIAHRMRTVENADKIVVLSDGKIAECDTPDKLIQKDSIFKHMTELQTASQNWTI